MSNVFSIFDHKRKKVDNSKELKEILDQEQDIPQGEFDTVINKNIARNEKHKKEREKANKSVLRSYRIKND